MPFKSKQPEGNGHATQLCIVRQGTLSMHVHCTEGCISGKRQAFIKKFKLIYRCFTLLSVHIVIKNRGPTVTK